MIFTETKFKGVFVVDIEKYEDERGFFARSWCQQEFKARGIDFNIVQCNISYNKKKGTLRGMHYQEVPFEEDKLVSCIRGSIYDVIIDIRPNSPTRYQWFATELSFKNYKMIYIPKGFAHGFQTLEKDTVVFYQMSEFFHPECAKGIRWDDPICAISWPISKGNIISSKDLSYPLLDVKKNDSKI